MGTSIADCIIAHIKQNSLFKKPLAQGLMTLITNEDIAHSEHETIPVISAIEALLVYCSSLFLMYRHLLLGNEQEGNCQFRVK